MNLKLAITLTMVIAWSLILLSLVIPSATWYFGIDRINISTLAFSFVTAYSLPTMVMELASIRMCGRVCSSLTKEDARCMRETLKYKIIGAIIVAIIPLL